MYNKQMLLQQISDLGISGSETLLIHSSMKSTGAVENGADTVLDAFIDYLKNGLLIFPTHTWAQMNNDYTVFNPQEEPSCVGILTNLFLKRPGVCRSWHPTHSVAAVGRDAESFVSGEEKWNTPCPRQGCWGKLYDRKGKILFIGCGLHTNTIIHGVEEWNNIPRRLSEQYQPLKILTPNGNLLNCPVKRHESPYGDVSKNYSKLETPLLHGGIAHKGYIGDALSTLCDVKRMVDMTSSFLGRNPDLFADSTPVPAEWYM